MTMQTSADIRQLPDEWVKLNLGCNRKIFPGWVNVDTYPFEGVDVVANLDQKWGWDDSSVHYIRAFDILEHLKNPVHTMNEAWRVLGHGGLLEVWVPSTDGRGAFQDPTHVSFWNQNSFLYYSRKVNAGSYPGLIFCDFQIRLFNTLHNPAGIVWTWALCRAIKDPSAKPVVSDEWFNALASIMQKDRVMPGFRGTTLGTSPCDGDQHLIQIG